MCGYCRRRRRRRRGYCPWRLSCCRHHARQRRRRCDPRPRLATERRDKLINYIYFFKKRTKNEKTNTEAVRCRFKIKKSKNFRECRDTYRADTYMDDRRLRRTRYRQARSPQYLEVTPSFYFSQKSLVAQDFVVVLFCSPLTNAIQNPINGNNKTYNSNCFFFCKKTIKKKINTEKISRR